MADRTCKASAKIRHRMSTGIRKGKTPTEPEGFPGAMALSGKDGRKRLGVPHPAVPRDYPRQAHEDAPRPCSGWGPSEDRREHRKDSSLFYAVVQPESPSSHRRWAVPGARGPLATELVPPAAPSSRAPAPQPPEPPQAAWRTSSVAALGAPSAPQVA